ncbi:MAG: 6-bladed beta-propeller [Treponema sp.]|nr:6-bladed beta-propeller [Treponema sp.]
MIKRFLKNKLHKTSRKQRTKGSAKAQSSSLPLNSLRLCVSARLNSLFFILLFIIFSLSAQEPVTGGTGADALFAAEEFRLGVQAFNRFAYNEAILSFERALSFRPGQPLILDWLGKAYYRSGFEETALRQWRSALNNYGRTTGTGMLLNARIETVANRRFLMPIADDGVRYVGAGRYPGRYENIVLYRQPTSVLPNNDGSIWIVAYGSNEILRVDVNGIIRDRRRGPLNGFDRPYDLARGLDGRMYLSEFRGGRISVLNSNGDWLSYIGSRGLGNGQLVGPQHLTIDEDGYLYVVDYGNRRITKYDPDGMFIISFGLRSAIFPGMLSPTGIAAGNGRIYITDSAAKVIYMFDPNGNYLGPLAVYDLMGPESLRFLSDGTLLLADGNRFLQIDPDTAIVRELGLAGTERVRITGADMDRNGNIVAANFVAGEVSVMTRFDDIASGFFVQIRNVNSQNFPQVTVELTVEDRLRRPILGLDNNNFLITENGIPVNNQTMLMPGFRYQGADISLLVERSDATSRMRDDFAAASRDINRALQEMGNSKVVSVISASTQPRREQHENSLENAVRGTADSYNQRWRFDLGLRLAATDLLTASPKRSVVYVGSGGLGELAFEQYSLSEMAAYLANNGIVFNAIIIGGGQISAGIEYLCRETGGKAMHLYRPRGIGELIKSAAETPNGLYSFTYNSRLPTDFGRAWLSVEAEVYLMERSGRDNTGYFAPLQ